LFPNKEFYDGKLFDASVVREESYNKRFLQGEMYSYYSFINIAKGKEQIEHRKSLKNMVEVAVISKIIKSLNKGQILYAVYLINMMTWLQKRELFNLS
jgi:senataxin